MSEHHRHGWWENSFLPILEKNKPQIKAALALVAGQPAVDAFDAIGGFDALLNNAAPLSGAIEQQAGDLLKAMFNYLDTSKNR